MKKQFILILFIFLFCFIISDTMEAKTKKSPFEYETESLGNGTCRIIKIRITRDKGISVLKVPEKINGETVVSIGPGRIHKVDDDLQLQNVFLLSAYCCGENPYRNIDYWDSEYYYTVGYDKYKPSQDHQKIRPMKIKKIILPDSIKEIKEDCFAMCKKLENVKLPKNLETIGDNAFSSTPQLIKIHVPAKLKNGMVNLAKSKTSWKHFTVSKKNLYYKAQKKMLISKDGKTLYAMLGSKKNIRIPDSVKTINAFVFYKASPQSIKLGAGVKKIKPKALSTKTRCRITISPSNPFLAKSGMCIYDKKTRALIVGIPNGNVFKISHKVKKLVANNISLVGIGKKYRIKKVYVPKKIKRVPFYWYTSLPKIKEKGCKLYYY